MAGASSFAMTLNQDPRDAGSRTIYTPALSHELAGKFAGNQATVGILISKESPFKVLHVYDLIDADGNIQGQPGYLNETVYAGDKLLYVDSVPTTGLSFYSVRSALDGPIGSHVTLTLERSNDAKLYEVRVRRHDPGQFIEGAPKTDLLETVHHPEMAKAASQASGLLDTVKSRLSGSLDMSRQSQSMDNGHPSSTVALMAEKENADVLRKVEDLQNMFDGLSHGIQRWEEVVDPKTSNVYYKDMLTGKVSGKYINVVPGADSYGFAGVGISLARRRGRATDDGPVFVNMVSEKSSAYGKAERGDRLLAVNGENVDNIGLTLIYALLNGRDGTVVVLRFSRDLRQGPHIFDVEAIRKNGIPLAEDLDKEGTFMQRSFNMPEDKEPVSTPATWIKDSMQGTPGFSLGLDSGQLEFLNFFQGPKPEMSKPASRAASKPVSKPAESTNSSFRQSTVSSGPGDGNKLEVWVDAARNLPVVGSFGLCDIYAEVTYGSEHDRTPVVARSEQGVNSSVNPDFNAKFTFERTHDMKDLVVSVYGREGLATIFIGQVTFPKTAQFLKQRGDQDGWYRLTDKSDGNVPGFRGEEPHVRVQTKLQYPPSYANLSSSKIDLPSDEYEHVEVEQERRRQVTQSFQQYTPQPTHLSTVPAMPGDDLVQSLIAFMESSAEGQEAMHARLQAIIANANRNSAEDLEVIAVSTRAFDAALKLKNDRVDVEKPFNLARTDIQHLNDKIQRLTDALNEKDVELASIRARESGTARVVEESRSDVQRLGGMLRREGTMRLSSEEHAQELSRQVQELQASNQQLRRDLAAEKAENQRKGARIAEKDKAFEKVLETWETHTTRSGTVRGTTGGTSTRPVVEADFELHGAVCADFHVIADKVEALNRELVRAEEEVEEFEDTMVLMRKALEEARVAEAEMEEALEAEGPVLEALRGYIEVLKRNAEAYTAGTRALQTTKTGDNQYTTMLEKELVQLQDQVERMGKDLLLSAQTLQGAMDNHQLAESIVHFSSQRLAVLARVRKTVERDMQQRHLQVETTVRGLKQKSDAFQRASYDHRDKLVRTLRGECDRVAESHSKFYALDPPPDEAVPPPSHFSMDRAEAQRKGAGRV
mmetsp:Transcript_441/g.905  ORF Transcript_441/g.905 Transcript_441/m.905 type:complete len:1108 (-) Transcript_441:78-3401(-)